MSILTHEELKRLSRETGSPCLSVYLPPVAIEPNERLIRLKNALSKAKEMLLETGLKATEATEFLAPMSGLLDKPVLWTDRNGLALFVSRKSHHAFRLPLDFPELVVLGDSFHLKPLMPLLSGDGRFFILALSQNSVRLFEASRYTLREVDKEDIPESLVDAVGYDVEQKSLQFHTGSPARGKGAKRDAIYHGQGSGTDDAEVDLEKFLLLVDEGLRSLLAGSDAPLVVAAVDSIFAAFSKVTKYSNVVAQGVLGSPEGLSLDDLHGKAWAIVSPFFRRDQDAAATQFHNLNGTPAASDSLEMIVPAACNARIDTLFVSLGEQIWGRYTRETESVQMTSSKPISGDGDLLDLAAVECLLHGGTVYAVTPHEMPVPGPVAALFRYERKQP